jgi:hypothetical protein
MPVTGSTGTQGTDTQLPPISTLNTPDRRRSCVSVVSPSTVVPWFEGARPTSVLR